MKNLTRRDFLRVSGAGLGAFGLMGLTGCGSSDTSDASADESGSNTDESGVNTTADTSAASDGEIVTITVYPSDAMMTSGVVSGYKADIMEQYGFDLEVWAYSDEKTNAILSSGSLADVMYVDKENLEIMIESGMVLNLEDYLDELPNITNSDLIPAALNYIREYNSAGTGELYAIPTVVGGKELEYGITKNMLTINWDYYMGIGAPEFNDQWELIDVMKQMQEAYPVGDDGVTNWETYLNSGSDGTYFGCINSYLKWFGYEPDNLPYLIETDMYNGEYHSILEDDSLYKEGLKWYNTLYREGLLDPDSISTDRATQKAKVDNGHAMVPSGSIQGYEASGYQYMYMDSQTLYQESWNSVYGTDYVMVVNAKSEHIEQALAFINMMADPDIYMQFMCGPEGELWYVEDGVTYMADGVVEMQVNGDPMYLSTGESVGYSTYPLDWVIDDTSFPTSYVDADGNSRTPKFTRWSEVLEITYSSEQMAQWREISGYDFLVDQAMANDSYKLTSDLDYVTNFTSTPDDMLQLTIDSIKDEVVNDSWQMVYASSDEEFESIWAQMVENATGLGAQDVIDYRLSDLEQAMATRDALNA